jgi:5-oxoprolinase (ATP-hydrolysing)
MSSDHSPTEPIQPRSAVWVDVGGTFTDCIVQQPSGRRAVKVLSSGLVRAEIESIIDARTLRATALPAAHIPNFWQSAAGVGLPAHGLAIPLGAIVRQQGNMISFDRELPDPIVRRDQAVIEIDAGLQAPVLAARLLLKVPLSQPLPPTDVRLGTTRGTNALLTRRGAATALLITQGFADILRIGEQDRPELFALVIRKPTPLTDCVVEVCERLDATGNVLQPMDLVKLRQDLLELRQIGIESLAICFLHAHLNDVHEIAAEQIARELGFANVSRSSRVAPLIKLGWRAETTTLDAYLNPILADYVNTVWDQFGGEQHCRLRLMTSGGNLVAPAAFRGCDSILSGPAGGVVALAHVAQTTADRGAIGLDMGGTSTDVSRVTDRVGRRYESRIAGVRVMTPMMDIHTIAAGGGSICDVDADGRMRVGPDSAGADPGPACYGRGGPLTITDANLLLGRLPITSFPFPLHVEAARRQLEIVRQRLPQADLFPTDQSLCEGFLQIAVTHMAEAVRGVSTAQGADVRQLTLVGFGGAAGQHVCRVADALGMKHIVDHPEAGLMSALGMGLASIGRVVTAGVYERFTDDLPPLIDQVVARLKSDAAAMLASEQDHDHAIAFDLQCDLRYQGTESSLALATEPKSTLATRFHALHRLTYGYQQSDRPIELVSIRCEATLPRQPIVNTQPDQACPLGDESISIWHQSQWVQTIRFDRESLAAGQSIAAPAMVVGRHSTLVIEPGWQGHVTDNGIIELRRVELASPTGFTNSEPTALAAGVAASDVDSAMPEARADGSPNIADRLEASHDPVLLEVIARRLQGIADAMGEVLRRTAISVNIKERRDYSCAVFRGDGTLVANAPHVPVHLGAMGHTVRHLLKKFPHMSRGDCYLSNDPFAGGSHLPDLTVVTPVFCGDDSDRDRRPPDFFVASRAHHAEIGGKTPGSMPPDATCLAEEGVVIRDFALVRDGNHQIDDLRQVLSSGPYRSRSVAENLADVAGQQAAGAHGDAALIELARQYTPAVLDLLMGRLMDVAAESMQRWIATLPKQPLQFSDVLDDGSRIGVTIARHGERLAIDFDTAGVHPHGFNATAAIVTAAVLYVLRTVSQSDLPLCDGVLRDVDLSIPVGILNPPADSDPFKCAAVVAGNVETSQRIVDVLLGALGVAAASQGTMNNVLLGDETFGYYETIGGGSGATADADGADAVHTHMTNTRITDPEVVESRLPVRLLRFAIRRGSGGVGHRRGGDGIIREFEFLRPLVVSVLTGRRTTQPYGMAGGGAGHSGRNLLFRHGQWSELPPTATIHVNAGDRLTIETPGGGGWGTPLDTNRSRPDPD